MKNNEYVAPRCEYNLVNDRKIYKVKEPYYSEKDRIIYAAVHTAVDSCTEYGT